jgi:hypothetical protein
MRSGVELVMEGWMDDVCDAMQYPYRECAVVVLFADQGRGRTDWLSRIKSRSPCCPRAFPSPFLNSTPTVRKISWRRAFPNPQPPKNKHDEREKRRRYHDDFFSFRERDRDGGMDYWMEGIGECVLFVWEMFISVRANFMRVASGREDAKRNRGLWAVGTATATRARFHNRAKRRLRGVLF